jgi:hypothetical protein
MGKTAKKLEKDIQTLLEVVEHNKTAMEYFEAQKNRDFHLILDAKESIMLHLSRLHSNLEWFYAELIRIKTQEASKDDWELQRCIIKLNRAKSSHRMDGWECSKKLLNIRGQDKRTT